MGTVTRSADREPCTAGAPRLCFICIRLRPEIDWASSLKSWGPLRMRTGFCPWEQGGGLPVSHTPTFSLPDRSSGPDNRAQLLRAKLQFNWEVSLAPRLHIQKQTQWGHLAHAAHAILPLTPPRLPPHLCVCNFRDPLWANEYLAVSVHARPPSVCNQEAGVPTSGPHAHIRVRALPRLNSVYAALQESRPLMTAWRGEKEW